MKQFKVPKLMGTKRYWFIRSGKEAEFFQIFKDSQIVAIGHLDDLLPSNIDEITLSSDDALEYTEKYRQRHKSKSKSSVSNVAGQIDRFIREISPNDIVVCTTPAGYIVGSVIDDAYLSTEILSYGSEENTTFCSYKLRRRIKWGEIKSKKEAPIVFDRLFKNPSTIFEITKNHDLIDKWLLPLHINENNEVIFSCRIEKKEHVSNRYSTKLSLYLDDLEAASYFISSALELKSDFDPEDIIKALKSSNFDSYTFRLTTQQAFMSPGDIFTRFPKGKTLQATIFALLLSMSFDCNAVFPKESDNQNLSQEILEKVSVTTQLIAKDNNFKGTKKSLELKWRSSEEFLYDSDNTFPEPVPSTDTPM